MTMDCTPRVAKMTRFDNSESAIVATVGVQIGPVLIWAKLVKTETGLFLSMPARKSTTDEKWWESAQITDWAVREEAQREAVRYYHEEAIVAA